MKDTKWIVILITAMLLMAALAGVILGIKEEFTDEAEAESK